MKLSYFFLETGVNIFQFCVLWAEALSIYPTFLATYEPSDTASLCPYGIVCARKYSISQSTKSACGSSVHLCRLSLPGVFSWDWEGICVHTVGSVTSVWCLKVIGIFRASEDRSPPPPHTVELYRQEYTYTYTAFGNSREGRTNWCIV